MRRARELLATRSRELVERVELRTGAWVEHAGKLARESRPAGRASRAPGRARSCGPGAVEAAGVPALWHREQANRAGCVAPGARELIE